MPTPTALPYVFSTPVADLLTTVADPTTGVPSIFSGDFRLLAATIIAVMWLAYFLQRFGILHRRP